MVPVNTMVSSTPCCTKPLPFEARHAPAALAPVLPWRTLLLTCRRAVVWVLALALLGAAGVRAQDASSASSGADAVSGLRLERSDEGLYLSARLLFALPALVEDALYKGIPMYFVMEAEVARERWYWTDRQVAKAARYLRLSYQPLTRRWRLNMATEPLERTGLGVVLAQNFDTLDEALDALQRVAHWKIAESGAVAPGAPYSVRLVFRLDTSQLARPFQIGALGSNGWNLALEHQVRAVVEARP